MKSASIFTVLLPALVLAGALAANGPMPAAAQTAKKLNCKGCVKSKQLKNKGVTSKDIKNGAVTAKKLSASALAAGREPIDKCRTIDKPGSYQVVANLGPGGLDVNGHCLVVAASFVTIDLGGFVLTGDGTGSGVRVPGSGLQDVTLRNGTITRFEFGTSLRGARPSLVEEIRAVDNDRIGIDVDSQSTVRDSIAANNGGSGISPSGPCVVTDNFVHDNGGSGLSLASGCLATGNVVTDNVGNGISAGSGSVISGNVVRDNGGIGISTSCPSAVIGNASLSNTGASLSLGPGTCAVADNAL